MEFSLPNLPHSVEKSSGKCMGRQISYLRAMVFQSMSRWKYICSAFCCLKVKLWRAKLTKNIVLRRALDVYILQQNLDNLLMQDSAIWITLRAPRPATEPRDGPTRNFHEKHRKKDAQLEILDSKNLPPKYPENTEKIPPKYPNFHFGCFFSIFKVFLGVPEFRAGGYFFGIFHGNFGSGHPGAL